MTRVEDARCAVQAGADAIGLVFYDPSPRTVSIAIAKQIAQEIPPFVTLTALFVDPDPKLVERVLESVPVGLLQFHGDEPESFCTRFGRPYIKAVRMKPGVVVAEVCQCYQSAAGLLLDAWVDGQAGGTGSQFDWQRIPADIAKPIVLAGGLNPSNVSAALTIVRPWAVDVSSGVELEKGIKSKQLIEAFMQGVHCVES
jgi:phosphoribosylanthranilate isomerase